MSCDADLYETEDTFDGGDNGDEAAETKVGDGRDIEIIAKLGDVHDVEIVAEFMAHGLCYYVV